MPKRVDSNQKEIVHALRKIGVSVLHLHTVGKGCPDIACGFQGKNIFMEIKDGNKPPSKRKLTPDEKQWHEEWRGQVVVVNSVNEALDAITL